MEGHSAFGQFDFATFSGYTVLYLNEPLQIMEKNINDLLNEIDSWDLEDEEAKLFGPRIDWVEITDVMARAAAKVKMEWRDAAIAAHNRGEPWGVVQNILENGVSQVVTTAKVDRLSKSRSDMERQHLRRELVKAKRRAEKEGNPDLVYQPWLEDVQALYNYAGPMPDNGDASTVYRFCTLKTNGPFAPGNVKWQSHDDLLLRLSVRTVEFWEGETRPDNPETLTLAEVAKRTGLAVGTLRSRYDAGVVGPDLWSGRNLGAVYVVDFAGTKLTLKEAAAMCGLNVNTLRARLMRGLKGADLFAKTDMRTGSDKKESKGLRSVKGDK
ncbi:Sigma-70, region 4 [compost metagenome]